MIFSASRLKTWMACPLQAYFKYDEGLPSPQNAAASWGSIIHNALEYYNTTQNYDGARKLFLDQWYHPEKVGLEPDYWPPNTSHTGYLKMGLDIIDDFHRRQRWQGRTVIGAEIPFKVPFGEHHLTGFIDLLEVRKTSRANPLLRIIDYKSAGRQPTKIELALDIQFCADEETEILTVEGWKRHDELRVGEHVLTLNHDTGLAEWQPTDAVNVFDVVDQEMLSMEGKAHSSLTTLNHRWLVEHVVSSRLGWRAEKRVVCSEDLTGADRIPCAAPVVDLPAEPKYSDAHVELVGWFWTEGHVVAGGSISMAQKEPGAEAIRSALIRKFGPAVESLRSTGFQASWRESRDADVTRFYLNRTASEIVKAAVSLPTKALRPQFITSLTHAQLCLLADVSVRADGHVRNGCAVVAQSDRTRLDSLQMVYSLLGQRTSLRRREVGGSGAYAGREFWELAVKDRRPNFLPKKAVRERVRYTGKVWCPTTANGSWYARRHGQVYFTGNTVYDYAVSCPEFWLGDGSIDYPGLPDGERMMDEFGELARRGIWYHLRTQKELDVGPRGDADYMRLYRVCSEIAKAAEAGIHVPRIGDACNLCDYAEQCTLEIPVHLRGWDAPEFSDENAWI